MVKREPYPVFHDESQFFTVNQPYPPNFEWEKPGEVLKFAHWIAACLGTHTPFWNFYYKPKAAFILLEIEKSADGKWMRRVLGEHKWKKILANPGKEEEAGYSQVFPCALSTADVRKSGWRSYEIKPEWFENWAPEKEFNVNPYPTPEFCEPPREDVTGLPLCRKLPKAFRPPPVVAPRPAVPGSAEWANDRSGTPVRGNGRGQRGRGRGASGRGNGPGNANTNPGRAWDQPLQQSGGNNQRRPPDTHENRTAKPPTAKSPPPPIVRVASSTPSSSGAWDDNDQATNIQSTIRDQPLQQSGGQYQHPADIRIARHTTTKSPPPRNIRVPSSRPSSSGAWDDNDQATNIQSTISSKQSTITMLSEDGEQLEASASVGIAMQMADKHVTPVNQQGPMSPKSRRKAQKEQSRLRNTEDDEAVPPSPASIVTLDGSVHANPMLATKSAWAKGAPDLKNGPPGLVHPSLSRIIIAEEDDEPDVALVDHTSTAWASDAPSHWMGDTWMGDTWMGPANPPPVKNPEDEPPRCTLHQVICKTAICDTYSKQMRAWKKEYRKRHNGEDPPLKPGPYNVKVAEREAAKRQKIEEAEKKEKNKKRQAERAQHEKEKAAFEKLQETREKAMEESEKREMEAERERKFSKPWDEYEDEEAFGSDPAEEILGGGKKDEGNQQPWKEEAIAGQDEDDEEEPW